MERCSINVIDKTIILIGAEDCGVTVGRLIAKQLRMPFLDLQESSEQYFDETDFEEAKLKQVWEEDDINGVYHYTRPYDAHAIKRGVDEHHNCVIRIGAIQAMFDDAEQLKNISDFLEPFSVVLLQPVEDKQESIKLIHDRNSEILDGQELNEYFLTHRSNFELAKQTVYTKDKTPEQTVDDILSQIDTEAKEIVIIGAQTVGKTTVAKILSEKLDLPRVSMDKERWKYFEEIGWSREHQDKIGSEEGFVGVYRYWKEFDAHAVKRMLQDHESCVIDFGAGQSIYDDPEELERVSNMLKPYPNVVHLLPSPDMQESIDILSNRRMRTINGIELIEFLISQPAYDELANHVVYTEGKSEDELKDAVLSELGLSL